MPIKFKPHRVVPVIPPATVTAADNGTSLNGTTVELGQAVGAVGNPGQLLNAREIPLNGFSINELGGLIQSIIDDAAGFFWIADPAGNPYLQIDVANQYYSIGDDFGGGNSNELFIHDAFNIITFSTAIGGSTFRSAMNILGDPFCDFQFGDCGANQNAFMLDINDTAQTWFLGSLLNNRSVMIADVALTSNELFFLDSLSTPRFQIGNSANGTSTTLNNSAFTASLELAEPGSGDLSQLGDILGGAAYVSVDPNNARTNIFGNNGLRLMQDTVLMHTGVALANGAGAAVGTLNNAPAAGNPTKWIQIDDNGTARFIPAW